MKVYIIHEDNHGVIGVADSYESAVQFLIDKEWITENYEILNESDDEYHPLNELGIALADIKEEWDIDIFNDAFYCCLYIEKTNLITDAHNKIEEVLANDGVEL